MILCSVLIWLLHASIPRTCLWKCGVWMWLTWILHLASTIWSLVWASSCSSSLIWAFRDSFSSSSLLCSAFLGLSPSSRWPDSVVAAGPWAVAAGSSESMACWQREHVLRALCKGGEWEQDTHTLLERNPREKDKQRKLSGFFFLERAVKKKDFLQHVVHVEARHEFEERWKKGGWQSSYSHLEWIQLFSVGGLLPLQTVCQLRADLSRRKSINTRESSPQSLSIYNFYKEQSMI